MTKIGFTGTQMGTSFDQFFTLVHLVQKLNPIEAHEGLCVGADTQFYQVVRKYTSNCRIVGHPPINTSKMVPHDCDEMREPKEYLVRNKDIVNDSEALIACPEGFEETTRSGTWSTVRYARKKGRKIYIIFPDGNVKEEN